MVARNAGEASALASPTMPITPTMSPAAASITTQSDTSSAAGSASATTASAIAAAPEPASPASATACTARRGTMITPSAVTAGSPTARRASVSRLVTQALQDGGVAGAELREDPLVEDGRDQCDERQVERHAKLDPERGPAR